MLRVEARWHMYQAEVRFSSAWLGVGGLVCIASELKVMGDRHLSVVFFEELDHPNIVSECDNVRPGKCFKLRHIDPGRREGPQDIFGEPNRIQLEVRLEQQIGRIVEAPFPRFFQWCSIQPYSAVLQHSNLRPQGVGLNGFLLLHTYH